MRTIDFMVEKEPREGRQKYNPRNRDSYIYPKLDSFCNLTCYDLRLIKPNDDSDTVIETVITDNSYTATEYLRHVTSARRCRYRCRLRSPSLAAISFHSDDLTNSWRWRYVRNKNNEKPIKNPVAVVSVCFGGSHCLIYQISPWGGYFREDLATCPIKEVLEDGYYTVIGVGMKKFVEKVKEEWECHVAADCVELRSLVQEAYEKKKKVNAEGMEIEEMAETVLGMKVRKKNKKARNFDWSVITVSGDEEMLMYACRDVYLAFEIGKNCFEKLDRKI